MHVVSGWAHHSFYYAVVTVVSQSRGSLGHGDRNNGSYTEYAVPGLNSVTKEHHDHHPRRLDNSNPSESFSPSPTNLESDVQWPLSPEPCC